MMPKTVSIPALTSSLAISCAPLFKEVTCWFSLPRHSASQGLGRSTATGRADP